MTLQLDVWSEGRAPAKPYWFNLNCAGVTTGVYAPQRVYVLGGTSEGITELSIIKFMIL